MDKAKSPGWDALFLNGSVVDTDIGIWSAKTRIKAKDLGITDSAEVRKALSLGTHRLLPKSAFDSISEIARAAKRVVDWHSLNFPFVRGARYVPADKLPILIEKLKAFREQFDGEVDIFVANYEVTKTLMLPVLTKALQDAAKTPEAAENALTRLKNEYPAASAVRDKFRLSWSVYAIAAPKDERIAGEVATETEAVKSIVQSMVMELRNEFTEKVSAISKVVARGGVIPEKMIASALEVMARVEAMNVMGDEALSRQVSALRAIVTAAERGGRKTTGISMTSLDDIQVAVEATADEAVRAAEEALTGVGRRQMSVDPGMEEAAG